jgi:hypothetical protein
VKIRLSVGAGLVAAGVVVAGMIPALAGLDSASAAIVTGTGSFGSIQTVVLPFGAFESDLGPAGLSCVPHGRCVAIFNDNLGLPNDQKQAYMATENGGTWSAPAPIPGLEASTGSTASVAGVSCPAPGDCLVVGDYYASPNLTGQQYGLVLEEVNGAWGQPQVIPGLAALASSQVSITKVACPEAGYCTVAGQYGYGTGSSSGFVVDEVAGKWGTAQPVPGLATLNVGGTAWASSLTCPSPRNCTLDGTYTATVPAGTTRHIRVFVDSEVNGTWQRASAPAIPDAATSNAQPGTDLACASAGNCLVTVQYSATPASGSSQYLLRQSGGKWSVSTASQMEIRAIACPALGSCVAGGSKGGLAATMRQVNGTWSAPAVLPGAAALKVGAATATSSTVADLACPSVGNCTAVGGAAGEFVDPETTGSGFVATEASGTWSRVLVPAGSATINRDTEWGLGEVACAAVATCATVGAYGNMYDQEMFGVAEIPLRASATTIGRSLGTVTFGHEQAEKIAVHVTGPSTPTARVTVKAGSKTVCTITLNGSGVGTCSLTASQLAAGSYQLVASYPGSYGLAASSSRPVPLSVVK